MPVLAEAFLDANLEKLRLLRQTDKGEVWLVSLTRTGEIAVLKRSFRVGLPYVALMEHPHPLWPKVLFCRETEGETAVVEEFVAGESLAARVEERRWLTEAEARGILLQLCDGLAALHAMGVIHRDIKPSNLILQAGNVVRLIDFDAARTVKEGNGADTVRLGTTGYAPPEQYGYGPTDARSDIFAAGATMKRLLGDGYAGALLPVLDRCTELDPKRRYASAAELRQAVLRGPVWRRGRLAAGILAAVMVAGGVFWYGNRSGPAPEKKGLVTPPTAAMDSGGDRRETSKPPVAPASDEPMARPEKAMPKPEEPSGEAETEAAPPVAGEREAAREAAPEKPATAASEKATPEEPAAANVIYAAAYLNDQRLGAWADDTNIRWGALLEIRAPVWEGWRQADGAVAFPDGWSLRLQVVNRSDTVWENPSLTVTYDDHGRREEAVFRGETLAAGEETVFTVPLGRYRVAEPGAGYPTRDFHLHLSGRGPQAIHSADADIQFRLMGRGEETLDEIIRRQEAR
ncbi:MAG: protein kinase [Schwartzia sp.]|nr:protein kinase [Schwartzia sp. (in: firmicutes)]